MKVRKAKSIKNQFVLNVGDEGAIFCYFDGGKLANKIFIDNPSSSDVKLVEKLLSTYPKTPIYLLVDVIEQNYSQQVLPPVSSFGIRQQVQRRIKRDYQPNDFTNVLFLNRATQGRKDWNFLFISLANSDPFAKWLDLILSFDNPFKGVYLLPLESTRLIQDIDRSILNSPNEEWELLVMHNKVGGFRIVAFKNGKLIFTRLAQNLVGDNIPEIIVGNMEQEISNTVEYLRRLAFKGEEDSKITIIAGTEVLQKVEVKALKFGAVHLFTPYDITEKLNLPPSVTDKDRFADILMATHFACSKKHVLKFNSPFTRKLEVLYQLIKFSYVLFAVMLLIFLGLTANEIVGMQEAKKDREFVKANLAQARLKEKELRDKRLSLPKKMDKLLEIMEISNIFPEDRYRAIRIVDTITPQFNETHVVSGLKMSAERSEQGKKVVSKFQLDISMDFIINSVDKDDMTITGEAFIKSFAKLLPKYKVSYVSPPKVELSKFEKVTNSQNAGQADTIHVPAKIMVTGEL